MRSKKQISKLLKISHHYRAQRSNLLEQCKQRFTLDNPRFADRYIKAEVHLLIHFCVRGIDEELVACFQREKSVTRLKKDGRKLEVIETLPLRVGTDKIPQCLLESGANINVKECRPYSKEQAMLVTNIKSMEYPEKIVPTLVWCERIDSVYGVLRHALYFSRRFGSVIRGTLGDGKGSLGGDGVSRMPDKFTGQVIQGGAEVLDSISRDQREVFWNRLDACDVIHKLSGLRIALSRDWVWIGGQKTVTLDLEIRDVLIGPCDFSEDLR